MGLLEWSTRLLKGSEDGPMQGKPGRNEPCWCGSGKKYKKCHLLQDERKAGERCSANCGPT